MSGEVISIDDIGNKSGDLQNITSHEIAEIRAINRRMRMLALNALIEAEHAGEAGRGFAVVSQEVRGISEEVEKLSSALETELAGEIQSMSSMVSQMEAQNQGQRLIDLALNAIEIVDRNLYERTCDVRWWATDSALVDCLAARSQDAATYAASRLGVILRAYTVYLDLWVCDLDGNVVASGRGDRYAVAGCNVADRAWFRAAKSLATGDDFHAGDVARESLLANAAVATYATPIRAGGQSNGRAIGILAIHFDWEPQARTIVEGVRLNPDERGRSRVLICDSTGRVIAASDGRGLLTERLSGLGSEACGWSIRPDGSLLAQHVTPGYETYRGLGWRGVILQRRK